MRLRRTVTQPPLPQLKVVREEAGEGASSYAPLDPQETLYFLHIEKTAGTSLKIWLADNFWQTETFLQNGYGDFSIDAQPLENLRFVGGHYGIGLANLIPGPKRVVTWLREPIDRTLSEYYYRRQAAQAGAGTAAEAAFPVSSVLEECLEGHEYSRLRADAQVTTLSTEIANPEGFFWQPEARLERAWENLVGMDFFGLTEHMQLSVDMLTWRYGWRPFDFDIRENTTTTRLAAAEVSARALAAAEAMNRWDSELYRRAEQLFQQRARAFLDEIATVAGDTFNSESVEAHIHSRRYPEIRPQLLPHLSQRYQEATAAEPRFDRGVYTFDQPLRGDGWGQREGMRTIRSFTSRWMRSEIATLDLALDRRNALTLRFRVICWFDGTIELDVDGRQVELSKAPLWERFGTRQTIFEAQVPASDNWESRLTTLTFRVPQLHRPCDHDGYDSADTRRLGALIDWIQVEPAPTAE